MNLDTERATVPRTIEGKQQGGFPRVRRRRPVAWALAAGILAATIVLPPFLSAGPAAARPAQENKKGSPAGRAPQERANVPAPSGQTKPPLPRPSIRFEVNEGQSDPKVKFLARGRNRTLFLTAGEAVLTLSPAARLQRPGRPAGLRQASAAQVKTLKWRLAGADRNAKIEGLGRLAGKVNYLTGNDPSKWLKDVASFAKVRYRAVYPGIDIIYYQKGGTLEYDFVIAPGSDPSKIAVEFPGVKKVSVDTSGNLAIRTPKTTFRQPKPTVYQTLAGSRKVISSKYVVRKGVVGFELGRYDRGRPLVIDPIVAYSSYLGSSGSDGGGGIAVDSAGNAFVSGSMGAGDFPGPKTKVGPGGGQDAFVAKINPNAQGPDSLVYMTYLGGGAADAAGRVAVDPLGNAYISGTTGSTNFPLLNQFQSYGPGGANAFVAKLNPTGSGLLYSTYLGASAPGADIAVTEAAGIAVDRSGVAYVTGTTTAQDFTTRRGFRDQDPNPANCGCSTHDAFLVKLNTNLSGDDSLVYGTYLGGSDNRDHGTGVAADESGNAFVTGWTMSSDFPVANAFQSANPGFNSYAFVTRINTNVAGPASLTYSTLLGGGNEYANDIAIDSSGNTYVTGRSLSLGSAGFPTTANAFQRTHKGGGDLFVTKLDTGSSGNQSLKYSTLLGGAALEGSDHGLGVSADDSGHAYVTGDTYSADFPFQGQFENLVSCPVPRVLTSHGVVAKLDTLAQSGPESLVYSACLSGSTSSSGQSIATGSDGYPYIAGLTRSADFPTKNGYQSSSPGGQDAFVVKLGAFLPQVTALVPNQGPLGGGTRVLVAGQRFTGAKAVRFGGVRVAAPCPLLGGTGASPCFTFVSDIALVVYSPAVASPGKVHVRVEGPEGVSNESPADLFEYLPGPAPGLPPGPSVTGLKPSSGPVEGGTAVGVSGTELKGATQVTFAGVAGVTERCAGKTGTGVAPCFTEDSSTHLTVYSPRAPKPTRVQVTVTTPAGTSAESTAAFFEYLETTPLPGPANPIEGPAPLNTNSAGPGAGGGLSGGTPFTPGLPGGSPGVVPSSVQAPGLVQSPVQAPVSSQAPGSSHAPAAVPGSVPAPGQVSVSVPGVGFIQGHEDAAEGAPAKAGHYSMVSRISPDAALPLALAGTMMLAGLIAGTCVRERRRDAACFAASPAKA